MTLRSIAAGLFGAVVVAAACYFNDAVIRQGMLIPHLMPVVVYGSLVFFLLLVNPLLRRLRPTWAFRRDELAVTICLVLASCAIPSWGLVQCLPTSVMMPNHFHRVRPGWQNQDVLKEAPPRMLADVSRDEDRALNGYVAGLGEGDERISPRDVPWFAWTRTLAFWVPLLLCTAMTVLALSVVVHRQWVHHEQLPYPISVFAHSLLPVPGKSGGSIFSQRLFWVGALALFIIHLNNYICRFWPDIFIPVRLWLDFTPVSSLVPTLVRGEGMLLLRPRIYFAVIALAYFISSDVSFSMATVPFIFCFLQGFLAGYGIMLRTGDHLSVKIEAYLFTGGYLGILLMMLYTGRQYYLGVLRRSVCLPSRDPVEGHVVWAMRTFMLGTLIFIAQLVRVGLDWQLAVLYTGLGLLIFVVVSRTIAETGAFHIGSEIFPGAIIMGVFGATALGPRSLIIMFLLSSVVLAAPGWSPMPFIVQGLKLADMSGVRIRKVWLWTFLAMLLAFVVALPATIYLQYDRGAPGSGWPHMLSSFPFENLVKIKHQLTAQGTLELSQSLSGWSRFAHMRPDGACMLAFALAVALAVGIGFGRLQFRRWPFHPVVFVFLGGYQGKSMAFSFLAGWIIKTVVSKYGGARLYQQLKPLMIGVIAGEMAGRLVPMVTGAVIYAIRGQPPLL